MLKSASLIDESAGLDQVVFAAHCGRFQITDHSSPQPCLRFVNVEDRG